jgi:hypothetical protein
MRPAPQRSAAQVVARNMGMRATLSLKALGMAFRNRHLWRKRCATRYVVWIARQWPSAATGWAMPHSNSSMRQTTGRAHRCYTARRSRHRWRLRSHHSSKPTSNLPITAAGNCRRQVNSSCGVTSSPPAIPDTVRPHSGDSAGATQARLRIANHLINKGQSTFDSGTKTRCLTTWLRPIATHSNPKSPLF